MKRSVRDIKLRRLHTGTIVDKNKTLPQHLGFSRELRKRVECSSTSLPGWKESRARQKDAVAQETVAEIEDFHKRRSISRYLPDAKGAMIENGVAQSRKVMESSMRSAYDNYVESHG